MSRYNLVLSSDDMTVMDEYTPEVQNRTSYQSEADLDKGSPLRDMNILISIILTRLLSISVSVLRSLII